MIFIFRVHMFIVLLSIGSNVYSQVMQEAVFDAQVKTIQFHNSSNPLESPIITLQSAQTLTLEFDILTQEIPDLHYRIIACDKNWNKAQLLQQEYLQTIGLLEFETIQHSINTTTQYIHFATEFPNSNISFLISGNYLVQVFDDYTEKILFQRRCMVVENLITIEANQRRPKLVEIMDSHQAIDISLLWEQFPISNPLQDIHVLVQQNNRWDNSRWLDKPSHVYMQSMKYTTEPHNCWHGNAEFTQFNFKNMVYAGEYIQRIDRTTNSYTVLLEPNQIQTYKPYIYRGDLNGNFLPSHDISPNDAATVADYATVLISLAYRKQWYDTLDIYVVGGFNNWLLTTENRMMYNDTLGQYTASLFLKQGYYDYALAFVSNDKKHIFTHEIEGSYYQTENKYEIFVFHYDISKGYDRIIAYQTIQTKK